MRDFLDEDVDVVAPDSFKSAADFMLPLCWEHEQSDRAKMEAQQRRRVGLDRSIMRVPQVGPWGCRSVTLVRL